MASHSAIDTSQTDVTLINAALNRPDRRNGSPTLVNPLLTSAQTLQPGALLADRYEIVSKMDVSSGEADLYLCRYKDTTYAAKIYRRGDGLKPDVIERLKSVDCPHIASPVDTGFLGTRFFEILPHFPEGSAQGQIFSLSALKSVVIPALLDALGALHKNGIIHKDLKPSNIMRRGSDVVLIDFGISSVRNDGVTMIVTQTGMTPAYAAPEALQGVFFEESDYYSMGITLFELFTGSVPYAGMTAEDVARFVAVQRLPFPDDMPQELRELICGLTYADLSNRHDLSNPNRRWTHDEVVKWLRGEHQILPGTAVGEQKPPFAYEFQHVTYESLPALAEALRASWNEAKRELCRGQMANKLSACDEQAAGICREVEKKLIEQGLSPDRALFDVLGQFDPNSRLLCWTGRVYDSSLHFGAELMKSLRASGSVSAFYDGMMKNNVLSAYVRRADEDGEAAAEALSALETRYNLPETDARARCCVMFQIAYLLSGERSFVLGGDEFFLMSELAARLTSLFEESYDSFARTCRRLIDSNNRLDPQFEAWMIACGQRGTLDKWKAAFSRSAARR